MRARPRVLVVSPHPDDETFLFGGTVSRYAKIADVHLLVLSDGEKGSIAVDDPKAGVLARRRPEGEELAGFGELRRDECREAARRLGVVETTFAGLPDGGLPTWLVPALRKHLRDLDPDIVISPSEAGTTLHPDHCWAALAIDLAIDSLLREVYGETSLDVELPAFPSFALRRWFTFTLPEAPARFDYWSELVASEKALTRVDVRDDLARKRSAAEAYRSQRHWLAFFDRVACFELPNECFVERMCIGTSAAGASCLLADLGEGAPHLLRDAIPGEPEAYTSSLPGFYADLVGRAEWAAARVLRAVILASGKGTRMNNPTLPKSLEPVGGRPIVRRIIDAIAESGADDRPIVVVGPRGDQIRAELGDAHTYVDQPDPLGTGHAVWTCKDTLVRFGAAHVLVVYGDMPLVTPETLRLIVNEHLTHRSAMTMGVVSLPDFTSWRDAFRSFGRIVRDERGTIRAIVEVADATEAEREIREVNPSLFVFSTAWLWANIGALRPDNRQGQLYLTDLVGLAVSQGLAPRTVTIPAEDALGANRREDLELAEALVRERLKRA